MSFCDEVLAASDVRETKQEVVDYYKQKYPGLRRDKKGRTIEAWRSHATTAYQGATGLSRDSAAREFQGKRGQSSGKSNKAIWEGIGAHLPPRAPSGGYHVYGTMCVRYSDDCEEREIDEVIAGGQAADLVALDCAEMMKGLLNIWQNDDIDASSGSPDECDFDCVTDIHVEGLDE